MALFGLRSVTDRSVSIDPTNVSGGISVILDVQPNDETVAAIALTLDGETIQCRGSSSDADPAAGLAASSQAEVDCFLNTAAVMGECAGMQLDPMYANGEHELGAFITTAEGERRDVVAAQPITLNNSGYVMVSHSPGSASAVVKGYQFYGGPAGDDMGNTNSFHACPVSYKGTTVAELGLMAKVTGLGGADLGDAAPDAVTLAQEKGAFTWTVNTAKSSMVENQAGMDEHWIINSGPIHDADGLLVTDEFRGEEAAKTGPLHFDFKAPTTAEGEIKVNKGSVVAGTSYSANAKNAVALAGAADMGVGVDPASIMIAVGDCSAPANNVDVAAAMMPNRTKVPFAAAYDGVIHISDLEEEDAGRDGPGEDDNGLDCYVAELTALADELGNAWMGGKAPASWLQTANFGVDKTAPALSDIEPESGLVFKALPTMTFEVDNPDLASGDDGTPLTGTVKSGKLGAGTVSITGRDGVVTLSGSTFAKDGRKTVSVTVSDGAEPTNNAGYSLSFAYDTKPPTFSLSRTQPDLSPGGASSVTVSVEGSISDASEIKEATLLLLKAADCSSAPAVKDTLKKWDLENGTNSVPINNSFVIEATGTGPEDYCFHLDAEDVAVGADTKGDGNALVNGDLGSFNVAWSGEPPKPGPTFDFSTRTDNTDPATWMKADTLGITEGDEKTTYWVALKDADAEPTSDAPVSVSITGEAGVSVNPSTLEFDGTADTLEVTVTVEHDTDIDSEYLDLTHKAEGFGGGELVVQALDDDFEIMVSPTSIREDDDAEEAEVTVSAGLGADITDPVMVTLGRGDGADDSDIASGSAKTTAVTVKEATADAPRMGVTTVMVDAADDTEQDEVNESIELTVSASATAGVYYKPASIAIIDDDPDITLSLSQEKVNEGEGTVTVTITATADAPVLGIVNLSLTFGGTATPEDYTASPTPLTVTIDTGGETATATVTITITDDDGEEGNETIVFSGPTSAEAGGKMYSTGSATLTIVDNDGS